MRELPIEAKRLIGKKYPRFVVSRNIKNLQDEIPVFMFHSVATATFEEQLAYLKDNGYASLSLAEFLAFLRGERSLKQPCVLLTFDDGDKSWYQVAFPLLEKYDFRAVGFLVPHYIYDQPVDTKQKDWLSWPEVIEMDRSGIFDMQSHTYYHDRIYTGPQVIDFYNPELEHNPLGVDKPWIEAGDCYTNQLAYGMPVYRNASRMEDKPRYIDDETVREACRAWVVSRGGESLFKTPGWRKELRQYYQQVTREGVKDRYESHTEQRAQMYADLNRARQVLEERLNKPVRHLCYPYGAGSDLAVSISQEAGYVSNFWVAPGYRESNKPGDSPFYIPRIKDDYIFRLPGKGRKPLIEIFRSKLSRRVQTLDLY